MEREFAATRVQKQIHPLFSRDLSAAELKNVNQKKKKIFVRALFSRDFSQVLFNTVRTKKLVNPVRLF